MTTNDGSERGRLRLLALRALKECEKAGIGSAKRLGAVVERDRKTIARFCAKAKKLEEAAKLAAAFEWGADNAYLLAETAVNVREGLKNQAVIYQADELGGEARVFLDPNTLSNDGTVALNGIYHSHNGRWAAYSISRSGSDWQEFYVIDMKTGQLAEDHIEWAKFSGAAWQGDGFYYSAYDRPEAGKEFSNVNATQKIYYHKMGTPQSEDVLFYQNPQEPKRFYFVTTNEEETVMFLFESGAGDGNNLFVKDLRRKDSPFVQATTDMNYQYSPVVTDDNHIYIFTNYQAPKGRLMVADIQHPELKNWREVVGEQQEVLTDVTAVNCQLIMTYQKDASDHAFVYTMDGQRKHEVKRPTVGSVSFYGKKNEPWCFYHFTS